MASKNATKIRLYKCIICPTRAANGLYAFPKSPDIRQKWLLACQKTIVKSCEKICHEHFEASCFVPNNGVGRNKLWKDSVPTLNLPQISQNNNFTAHDHSYSISKNANIKVSKKKISAATRRIGQTRKKLHKTLDLAISTINSLCTEINQLKHKMASKDYKEKICYEMLEGKLSIGQLDILVKVSTLWGFHTVINKKTHLQIASN